MNISVDAKELAQAISATLPHTDDEIPQLDRLQFHPSENGQYLIIAATTRYTSGIASVPLVERDGELWEPVEIAPDSAKHVRDIFKPGKDEILIVNIESHANKMVTITDTSGLFAGESLTIANIRGTEVHGPDVQNLIAKQLATAPNVKESVTYNPEFLSRFTKAGTTYKQPLRWHYTDNETVIVTCGSDFVGLIAPIKADDDSDVAEIRSKLTGQWADMLPAPKMEEVQCESVDAPEVLKEFSERMAAEGVTVEYKPAGARAEKLVQGDV